MTTETTITGDEVEAASSPEARGFHLLVMSPESFFTHPLPLAGTTTVGRSSKCDVRFDDPLASREHASFHLEVGERGTTFSVEDLDSANGTRVRDSRISKRERAPIQPGEAVMIGSTVLMVLQDRTPAFPRRLWSHAYFETRVEEECARAARSRSSFALVRIHFTSPAPWTKALPVLARDIMAPHGFAAYGPQDYEVLLVDIEQEEADTLVEGLLDSWRRVGLEARAAAAWFPRDGRSADALLARANALLRPRAGRDHAARPVIPGDDMAKVREMAARAAPSSINVLILGETGVGKDVLARLIHRLSPRAAKPLVALNCASLAESLIESELFGHEKGAFTGAGASKLGLLESAGGGTVFLDEIGEMALPLQAKLLRVIEAREVMPVGAVRARPIDVRFVAATNRDLEAAVLAGTFRRDLMFRLNGVTLAIPPLRERTEEIPALVESFVADACAEAGRDDRPTMSAEALDYLLAYAWPGNIRELRNVVERALVLCDGSLIRPEHLPLEKMRSIPDDYLTLPNLLNSMPAEADRLPPITDRRKLAERQRIVDALTACASNQTRAAELLGMPRRTFVSKLDHYGIPRPQKRPLPVPGSGRSG